LHIQTITNGVCASTYRPLERRRSTSQPRLLAVSRLVRRKGLEDVIAALASPLLSACTLTLVGDGPLRSRLQRLARSLGVTDRVEFAGRLHGEELSASYRTADCFVLPSHAESCSMSLLEALASGLPLVAARTGGIPELVEDRVNGRLFAVGDVDDLAQAIAWILESGERMRSIGAANRARAVATHSWASIAALYEQRCYAPEFATSAAADGGGRGDGQAQCDQATP
jgi:glycosyltransferase involved in cell wall biosynthesis